MEEGTKSPFQRQMGIDGWNQPLIENQICLVLGAGGIGSAVAFALARLGVSKIILWDFDTVDVTNLNRQILFSKEQVGLLKVEAAAEGLKTHLVGSTKVETHNADALKNWSKIVELAKESTVIFNGIDVGSYFDYAVISLAKSLGIPYASGSSYSRTWIFEYYTGKKTDSSFSYTNRPGNNEIINKLHPSKITSLPELDIPHDPKPDTQTIGSNVLVCAMAGLHTVNAWVQGLMGLEMPNWCKGDMNLFWKEGEGVLAWPHSLFPDGEDL